MERRLMMHRRIRSLRGWLDRIAYASLAADIAIAVVTLVYVNTHAERILNLELTLNYVLTAIVIVSVIVLAVIGFLSMYIRVLSARERAYKRRR